MKQMSQSKLISNLALIAALSFSCSLSAQKSERERKPPEKPAAEENAAPTPKNEDPLFKGMKYRVIGPFRGGRSLTAAGIPGDPNTYYFGATGGGGWKSTDGAVSQASVFDMAGISSIVLLLVAPSDPSL